MARKGFLVAFPERGRGEPGIDRIRNWAEDLFHQVRRNSLGSVVDPDRSTDKVWVVAASPRATGDLAAAIRRSLQQHELYDNATVTKLVAPGEWAEYETFLSQGGRDA